MTGYESSLSSKPGDQSGDQGLFAVEMEPEEVHWIRVRSRVKPGNEATSEHSQKTTASMKLVASCQIMHDVIS